MPANASRIHACLSHMALRYASRTAVMGPLPLTTRQNSSQSGWDQIHSPSCSSKASSGSGTEMPTSHSLGTYVEKNSCLRSSLDLVLMPQYKRTSLAGFEGGP